MIICSNIHARRWVCLILLALVMPANGQTSGHGTHSTNHKTNHKTDHKTDHNHVRRASFNINIAPEAVLSDQGYATTRCGDNRHRSVPDLDHHSATTMTEDAGCDGANHPCQCLSGTCASPMAPVASISMPLLAPAVDLPSDSTFLPEVRRTGARYRPPIQF